MCSSLTVKSSLDAIDDKSAYTLGSTEFSCSTNLVEYENSENLKFLLVTMEMLISSTRSFKFFKFGWFHTSSANPVHMYFWLIPKFETIVDEFVL